MPKILALLALAAALTGCEEIRVLEDAPTARPVPCIETHLGIVCTQPQGAK